MNIAGFLVGGFIVAGLVVLFFLRSGAMGCKYVFVPDGEDWRTFYRQHRDKKGGGFMSGRWMWVIIGGGVGMAVILSLIHI